VRGRRRPDIAVAAGERVLAWCTDAEGRAVAGTRDAVYLPDRIPWEQVEAADWDAVSSMLHVSEVGTWGAERPEHRLTLVEPERLLQLVRERVTATVVLQRHVPVDGRRGLRVIARRAPGGDRPISWFFEFDEGVDPADPAVRAAADAALTRAQDEVGAT